MTAMDEPKAFTLDDISALAELPRRTVRYYIQSGLIDRPQGVGKGAYYTQSHVDYLAEVILYVNGMKESIRGVRMVSAPETLRHFTARMEMV